MRAHRDPNSKDRCVECMSSQWMGGCVDLIGIWMRRSRHRNQPSTNHPPIPHHRHSRNNVSIALLLNGTGVNDKDGDRRCVLVDAGKTMRDALLRCVAPGIGLGCLW